MKAEIVYSSNSQKKHGYFDSVLTDDILTDICRRITGHENYSVRKITTGYNKGRLVYLYYKGVKYFISISVDSADGRNSSLQSVPTAINLFYADENDKKELCYYFIPHRGNLMTSYHMLYYRMMATAGFLFLNIQDMFGITISPYSDIDEIINDRSVNQGAQTGNNSSYISKTRDRIQIYGKVYGANKYESTLFGIVAAKIADRPIDLFSISEQDLRALPASSIRTLENFGNISIHQTSLTLERQQFFEQQDKNVLRSPTYIYNLLNRIGRKRCALCGCEIDEIIQGAHVWPVADIAKSDYDDEIKFEYATSGHNGLWLCQNHHKLFDSNILYIDMEGKIWVKKNISDKNLKFISQRTNVGILSDELLSEEFKKYLSFRNQNLDFASISLLHP